ncbi:DNA nucleotidylexotransferase [Anas platyrhynchos]|uniref:DNA nucleotidylexotransferase n=1 Tax=Anas platyrhynchos TaxID=8839 RepID=R0K684_ANAPL|nr:DNA nucleotidylexotransferase [Anas platyrhynchos]
MKYRLMEQADRYPTLNTPESEVPLFTASKVSQYSCQRKTTLNNCNKKFTVFSSSECGYKLQISTVA